MANLSRTLSDASGSIYSDTSNPIPPDSLVDMEDEAIKQLMEQLEHTNKTMGKEVEMFEKFLKRLDPKDTQAKSVQTVPSLQLEGRTGAPRKKGKQRIGSVTERLLRLSVEQKCDIATRELDELREDMTKQKEEREKVLDHHKAMLTESEHRFNEVNKLLYEFERDILRGAVSTRTGKLLGERVVKFFEDYIRSRDNLMEKLRLKNSTLRVKKQKLVTQLKQKEESGEVRHEVDFDQLKIENKQLLERVEEKNQELLELKLSSGKTMLILNSYKQRVQRLVSESKKLQEDLEGRKDLLDKINIETELVIEEKQKAEIANQVARRKLEDYHVPDVMDYVKERASHHELLKRVHIWERKLEIVEMTLHTYQQTWKQLSKQTQHLQVKGTSSAYTLYT